MSTFDSPFDSPESRPEPKAQHLPALNHETLISPLVATQLQTIIATFHTRYPTGYVTAELLTIHQNQFVVRALIYCGHTCLASAMAASQDLERAEDRAKLRAIATVFAQHSSSQSSTSHSISQQSSFDPSHLGPSHLGPSHLGRPPELGDFSSESLSSPSVTPSHEIRSGSRSPVSSASLPQSFSPLHPPDQPSAKTGFTHSIPAPSGDGDEGGLTHSPEPLSPNHPDLNPLDSEHTTVEEPDAPPVQEGAIGDRKNEALAGKESDRPTSPQPASPSSDGSPISDVPSSSDYPSSSEKVQTPALRKSKKESKRSSKSSRPASAASTDSSPVASAMAGVSDLSDIIAKTSVELKRLGWSDAQGRDYLKQAYGKRSRQQLTDPELLDFLRYLEAQPSPYPNAQNPEA